MGRSKGAADHIAVRLPWLRPLYQGRHFCYGLSWNRESEMSVKIAVVAAVALGVTAAAPAVAGEAEKAAASAEENKLICKKILETGSLVRKRKQCFTKAEWAEIAESQRRGATKMIDELQTRPSGQ